MCIADFKPWIPKEAISGLKEIKRLPDLEKDDFSFLMPLLEDESMKSFYNLVKNQDRFFFSDLFYSLLLARKNLFEKQNKHSEKIILQTHVASLKNQITKMKKTLKEISKTKHYPETQLFEKFPTLLDEMDNYNNFLDQRINPPPKTKNKLRPINHKNLNKKLSDKATSDYCARWLYEFFKSQESLKISAPQRKRVICDFIDVLFNWENPMTTKDLDDLIRNG